MKEPERQRRNPGPSWGYGFLLLSSRLLPRPVLRPLLWLGCLVAAWVMPAQRRSSRAYLAKVLPRQPRFTDTVRHFAEFTETLIRVLQAGHGRFHAVAWAPGEGAAFMRVLEESPVVLFGSFHIGHADLLGYLLGRFNRRAWMVRIRVGNSEDTRKSEQAFGSHVRILWVDNPENMTFAVKRAIAEGECLAMKCDRVEGARKTGVFPFLGSEREFPLTIYHFAILFQVPVLFALGVDDGEGGSAIYAPEPFVPRAGAGKAAELARGREHFGEVLEQVERLLRRHPYVWFNFGEEF